MRLTKHFSIQFGLRQMCICNPFDKLFRDTRHMEKIEKLRQEYYCCNLKWIWPVDAFRDQRQLIR